MRVGIVGSGKDKFTPLGESRAKALIQELLSPDDILISGHSPVGGIDIWAEEIAVDLGCTLDLKIPMILQWNPNGYGYKRRNLDIADSSDVVCVIVVTQYPPNYSGMRFPLCYHCNSTDHVKSGGCWTGHYADEAIWFKIEN